MRISQWGVALATAFLTAAAFGCGSSRPAYDTARLEGAVTIAGKPVETGRVRFMPDGPAAQPAEAQITAGRYLCEHAPRGNVRATFYIVRETGETKQVYNRTVRPVVDLVPKKYKDGIPLNVAGDSLTHDFQL